MARLLKVIPKISTHGIHQFIIDPIMTHHIQIKCNIANEATDIEARFNPDYNNAGAHYILLKNGEQIGSIGRYPNGKYHSIGETNLSQDDVDVIGDQIDLKTDS
jgi:hypothetical protein